MSERPNLTLPPREEWAPASPRGGRAARLALGVALTAVLALQVYALVRPAAAPSPAPAPASGGRRSHLPPGEIKEVATRLQRNNLHSAAAAAYEEYLEAADLAGEERGKVLTEVGSLLAKAGRHEEALARFYQAEHLVGDADRGPLRRRIAESLERLGKYSERAYDLADGAGPRRPGARSPGDQLAGTVVAWIGPEQITASDLDDLIAREVEDRAAAMPGLPPEKVAELKAEAQRQLSSPEARLAKLQEHLAREVLYREGRERGADKSPRVERRLEGLQRDLVVEEVALSALEERVKVSEGDLRNHFLAHPARYREEARTRARVAVLPDQDSAREALSGAKSAEEFSRLVRAKGAEAVTPENIAEGEPVPGLGPLPPEFHRALREAAVPGPLAAPVPVPQGFAVAYVEERKPERSPPFEEVRERVARDYVQAKSREVQAALVKELFEKHRVSVATEAFLSGRKDAPKAASPASPGEGGGKEARGPARPEASGAAAEPGKTAPPRSPRSGEGPEADGRR